MKKNQDKKQKYAHFIGIGGIGISALAQWYLSEGWGVSGTDIVKSDITKMLKKFGADIILQNQNNNAKLKNYIKNSDLVIYTTAISKNDFQIKYAKKLNKNILSYPEALGELTRKYKTICVSGTHGKSTTTAMLANIMIEAGMDPTVILGTKMREFDHRHYQVTAKPPLPGNDNSCFGNNFRKGNGEWLLIEADEYKGAFLNYSPRIIVLTNIDKDHMDYYKDMSHILNVYSGYIKKLPRDGTLIFNGEDENVAEIRSPRNISQSVKKREFSYEKQIEDRKYLEKILKVPGKHNIYNALAALTAARALGVADEISFKALAEFSGAWRRFEDIGNYKGAVVISDYAHNPQKIKALVEALICKTEKEKRQKEIILVFQPHHQKRLETLFDDFVEAFGEVSYNLQLKTHNLVIITDTYNVVGREGFKKSSYGLQVLSSRFLVDAINKKYPDANIVYVPKNKLRQYLKNKFHVPSSKFQVPSSMFQVLCFAGAGDIDDFARKLIKLSSYKVESS